MLHQVLLSTWALGAIAMLLAWCQQYRSHDASYVDVVWSTGIGVAALLLGLFLLLQDQLALPQLLILACVLAWSIRLSAHLCRRLKYLGHEDSRYQTMRAAMGKHAQLGYFIFFQLQAIFIVIFFMPIATALLNPATSLQWFHFVGLAIFILALAGESIADRQLLKHRQTHGKGVTCQDGLWYYSRHPNYFFEWLHWFAYVFFSIGGTYFWFAFLGPWLMLIFILKLTGIPHVEREASRKRADYAEYQRQTSLFIPLPKRK